MVLATLLGVGYLTAAPPPGSVRALMPGWVVVVWAIGLLGSGLLGMYGCIRQALADNADTRQHLADKLFSGLVLERAAIGVQTGVLVIILGSSVYAWAMSPIAPFPALGIGFIGAWMAANVWRDRQISGEVRQLQIPADPGD